MLPLLPRLSILTAAACTALTLLLPTGVQAQNTKTFHPLTNPGFESQALAAGSFTTATPPGWAETNANGANSFTERINGFIHQGMNHEGIAANDAIWQDTNVTPQAGRKYTLIAAVGNRDSIYTQAGNSSVIRLLLVNGGTVTEVAAISVNATTIPQGSFRTFSASYTASSTAPAGSFLRIRLQVNSGDRAHFDDVNLISCVPHAEADRHPQTPSAPQAAIPIMNSGAGHPNVLYLDFDGESLPAMIEYNCGESFTVAHSGLSTAEVQRAFEVVKEDYRPFRINVTTDPARYWAAAPGTRMRCIITPTDTWTYRDLGSDAGNSGQATWLPWLTQLDANGANLGYMGFQKAGDLFHREAPCFVFMSTWAGNTSFDSGLDIGKVISHETGHTLGLFHDGYPANDYFPGHGPQISMQGPLGTGNTASGALWSPIMGRYGYLTQWSRGEYAAATNAGFPLQDDVAIIAAATGYFIDADNSFDTAVPLTVSGSTFAGSGIISRTATGGEDADYFRFTLSAPATVSILCKPSEPFTHANAEEQQKMNLGIANLFLHTELYRPDRSFCCNGTRGASSPVVPDSPTAQQKLNPTEFLRHRITRALDAGTWYFKVLPTSYGDPASGGFSNYGNMGEYSFTGAITWAAPEITSPLQASGLINQPFSYQSTSSMTAVTWTASGLPSGVGINSNSGLISGTPTVSGTFNVNLRAATPAVYREETLVIVIGTPGPPVIISASNLTAEEGQPFFYQVVATGGATSYGVSGGAISGLGVHPTTGELSGIPTVTGNWSMTVTATNAFGTGFLGLNFTIRPGLAAAVDDPSLVLSHGGNAPWFHQTAMSWNGGDAARSGAITHNQASSFQTTVSGPYGLTFIWRTDCEQDRDGVRFEMDGVEKAQLSGPDTSWYRHSFLVPPGSHTLKWIYSKDAGNSSGADAAWVDEIVLGSAASAVSSSNTVLGTVGVQFFYTITGTFDPVSYSLTGTLPPGTAFFSAEHMVLGRPSRPGSWPVTVGVTNAYGTGTMPVTFIIQSSFQAWASTNGLTGPDASPTADPDRDGWNNLLEMAFGQNPKVRNPAFQPLTVDPATKRLRATFTRNTQYADLLYQVQTATATAGPWTTIAEARDGQATTNLGAFSVSETGAGPFTVTVTDTATPPGSPRRFMRIKIIQQ